MVIGCMYIILYTNLMTIGYDFNQYISFISKRVECYLALGGLIIIALTIFFKKGDHNEIHL